MKLFVGIPGDDPMRKTCLILFILSLFVLTAGNPLAEDLLPRPGLEFLFELTATLEPPQELGKTKYGTRRIINISGGTFSGPKIKGVARRRGLADRARRRYRRPGGQVQPEDR
jgi:hypothetical protein